MIKIDRKNISLLVPLTAFAVGTLVIGSNYGPVSAFIPFWASVFMLITCLFVILGFDSATEEPEPSGQDEKKDAEGSDAPDLARLLGAVGWITAFVVIAYYLGLLLGSVIYAFSSMYHFGGKRLASALVISVGLGLCLFGLFEYVLEKELYEGLLVEYVFELVEG